MPLVPAHGNKPVNRVHVVACPVKRLCRIIRVPARVLECIVHHAFDSSLPEIESEFQSSRISIILVCIETVFNLVIGRDNFGAEQIINIPVKKSYIQIQPPGQFLPEPNLIGDSFFGL